MNVTAAVVTASSEDRDYIFLCVYARLCWAYVSTSVFRANSAGCLWGCTEIKDCAVVMQILKFCLKSLFFFLYWKSSVCWYLKKINKINKKKNPNNPPPPKKNKPCSNMQHSFSVNNRDLCAVKAGPWWTNSMAQLQQTTHRWGRFPSFRGADESEILGLVSTEWGRSVLCHHWYVVWRRCGGHRRALWDKTKKKHLRHECNLRCI